MKEIRIALIADTHIRPKADDGQFAFPSDHLHNEQAVNAVSYLNEISSQCVIHMGDVVHPLPHQDSHSDALQVAESIFSKLNKTLHFIPGNHDIGDKVNTANAPEVEQDSRASFKKQWGELFQAIEYENILCLLIDSVLLCSEESGEQREWLEEKVKSSNKRIFIFSHFPPFLFEADEAEHYDNYDKVSRRWFLELIKDSNVEAVFSAHVHRFFYNRLHGIDFYTVPGTSFVRPEYAGLRTVVPSDSEHGRNDLEQLGITVLHISETSHRIEIKKIYSDFAEMDTVKKTNLGLWLHRKLGAAMDIEYSDLDLLSRKSARYDHALIHILDLGISRIRIPLDDLQDKAVLDRVNWLQRHNVELTVYSAGIPDSNKLSTYRLLEREVDWEWVLKERDYDKFPEVMSEWQGPKGIISRIGKSIASRDKYHSHFPRVGFEAEDTAIFELSIGHDSVKGAAFRINDKLKLEEELTRIIENTQVTELDIHCHIELPYHSESKAQTDDSLVNERCLDIRKMISKYPEITFYIDLLQDKDRGYWPRHGLVDRADKPRMAYGIIKGG